MGPPPCSPSSPPCLWALLAQACLSIFVTASKFDVSYSQLTASEPCMNELAIYTKCLIKSAAAPGINIAGRLGMLAGGAEERARVFAQGGVCGRIRHLAARQSLCAAPDTEVHFQFHLMLIPIVEDAPHGCSKYYYHLLKYCVKLLFATINELSIHCRLRNLLQLIDHFSHW